MGGERARWHVHVKPSCLSERAACRLIKIAPCLLIRTRADSNPPHDRYCKKLKRFNLFIFSLEAAVKLGAGKANFFQLSLAFQVVCTLKSSLSLSWMALEIGRWLCNSKSNSLRSLARSFVNKSSRSYRRSIKMATCRERAS